MVRPALPASALLLVATLWGATGHAAEEELILAVEPGWGLLSGAEDHHALGGNATAWLGLTDTLWLELSAGGLRIFGDGVADRALVETYAGLVAALDVLRAIPFFEAALGATFTGGGGIAPGLRFGLGADYLVSRSVSVGLVLRYTTLEDELAEDGLLSANLRLGLRLEL